MNITNNRQSLRAIAVFSFVIASAAASFAQAATSLPGGASSLTETYGNWTVSCLMQPQDETKRLVCSMSQQQVDEKKQRALAIELSPAKDVTSGVLVLPFGLQLAAGTVLQIDEAKADKAIPFTTCLPAGCVVPVTFDAAKADAISKGKNLIVSAQAVGGNEIKLNIPLDGFTDALKRTRDLLK